MRSNLPVINVYKKKSIKSKLVTQILYGESFKIIKKKGILNKKHIMVLHREKGSRDSLTKNLDITENRIYGRSEIFFLKLF